MPFADSTVVTPVSGNIT